MRLIDADKLKESLIQLFPDECLDGITFRTGFKQILSDIYNEPIVDPMMHGHWIDRSDDPDGLHEICSVCSSEADITRYKKSFAFCPNCGAKMEGDNK